MDKLREFNLTAAIFNYTANIKVYLGELWPAVIEWYP